MAFGRKEAEVADGVSLVSDSLLVTAIAFCFYAGESPRAPCGLPPHPPLVDEKPCAKHWLDCCRFACTHSLGTGAGNTFFWRRRGLRRKDDTDRYDDPYGPTILAAVLLFALAAIFTSGLVKLATNDALLSAIAR